MQPVHSLRNIRTVIIKPTSTRPEHNLITDPDRDTNIFIQLSGLDNNSALNGNDPSLNNICYE